MASCLSYGLIFGTEPKNKCNMKQVFTFSFAVLAALVTFSGCKKEGCNDPNATNYNEDAAKDDGSCTYEGSAVFWFNQGTANFMESLGVSELNFYFEGNLIGTRSIADFYTVQPDCADAGSVTVTKSLGDKKSRNFMFTVEDQDNFLIDQGLMGIRGGECTVYRVD